MFYRSEEWNYISDDDRAEMGLTFSHDGEFWSVLVIYYGDIGILIPIPTRLLQPIHVQTYKHIVNILSCASEVGSLTNHLGSGQ